ncbi:hypothetical protein ACHAPA_001632 [Fusarium lateritium]
MAQAPSMGEAKIRELIKDENASLQRRIKVYTEENRGLQDRLTSCEVDSQRLKRKLAQEKRKRQKARDRQDQHYLLLEAEVKPLKERLNTQSSMSLAVEPQQTEEHMSETHNAISPEPWTPGPQDSIRLPAHTPEGFQLPSLTQEKPRILRYTVKNGGIIARSNEYAFEIGFEQSWVSQAT